MKVLLSSDSNHSCQNLGEYFTIEINIQDNLI